MSYHVTHPMHQLLNPQRRYNLLLHRNDERTTDTLTSMLPHAKWLQGDNFCHPSTPNLHYYHPTNVHPNRFPDATSFQRDEIHFHSRFEIEDLQHSERSRMQSSTYLRPCTTNTPVLQTRREEPHRSTQHDARVYVSGTKNINAQIGEYDVVFERGGIGCRQPGNLHYKKLVEDIRHYYRSTSCRKMKKAMIQFIIDHISKNLKGKFLFRDGSGKWVEPPISLIRKKVRNAVLRTS